MKKLLPHQPWQERWIPGGLLLVTVIFTLCYYGMGCSAYRGVADTSMVSVRRVEFNVNGAATNVTDAASAAPRSAESPTTQTLAPRLQGVTFVYVEKAVFLSGGGAATSNNIPLSANFYATP